MLKPNTSPKSPRIELSNDTFAERKCCQVFAYESETFQHRRFNGISHSENGELKPLKRPLPVGLRWPPSNTAVPQHTASTTPNRSSDGWGTVAHVCRKVPVGCNGAAQIRPQKYPFPWTPKPAWSLDPPDLWCQMASGSDPPFFYNALDRQTNAHTGRQNVHRKVWWLWAAVLRERHGLIIIKTEKYRDDDEDELLHHDAYSIIQYTEEATVTP